MLKCKSRQGENTGRFTLASYSLGIQSINPFHGLYVTDFSQIPLRGRQIPEVRIQIVFDKVEKCH